ncbi:MAG: hypothetical protein ACYCZM_01670 [Acidimicrobiales bacterium]
MSIADGTWDRLIVATALALEIPLVSRDQAIQNFRIGRDDLVVPTDY